MRQQSDVSGNRGMFGISYDRAPVNESVLGLLIVRVKAGSNAVAVGLRRNFECGWGAKLEFQFEAFAIDLWRFIRQQIWHAAYQTRNATKNHERPTLRNQESSSSLSPNQDGRSDSND